MKKYLPFTLLLLALQPLTSVAEPGAATGKKVELRLSPDSTRDDVKAALAARGAKATDAQIDGIMAQLAGFGLMGPERKTTTKDGVVWRVVQVNAKVNASLKGAAVAAGAAETFHVLVKESECDTESLTGRFARNPSKIVFLGKKGTDGKATVSSCESMVWTDGELSRAQLKRVAGV